MTLKRGHIAQIGFEGAGCAISRAPASLMTNMVQGRSDKQALDLFARAHAMLTVESTEASPADAAQCAGRRSSGLGNLGEPASEAGPH